MENGKPLSRYIIIMNLLALGFPFVSASARPGESSSVTLISGKPLAYWIAQAEDSERNETLDTVISALMQAVEREDPLAKVAGADALVVLGARAKQAVPVLIDQLGHGTLEIASLGAPRHHPHVATAEGAPAATGASATARAKAGSLFSRLLFLLTHANSSALNWDRAISR